MIEARKEIAARTEGQFEAIHICINNPIDSSLQKNSARQTPLAKKVLCVRVQGGLWRLEPLDNSRSPSLV
jgi:hypothetical protein